MSTTKTEVNRFGVIIRRDGSTERVRWSRVFKRPNINVYVTYENDKEDITVYLPKELGTKEQIDKIDEMFPPSEYTYTINTTGSVYKVTKNIKKEEEKEEMKDSVVLVRANGEVEETCISRISRKPATNVYIIIKDGKTEVITPNVVTDEQLKEIEKRAPKKVNEQKENIDVEEAIKQMNPKSSKDSGKSVEGLIVDLIKKFKGSLSVAVSDENTKEDEKEIPQKQLFESIITKLSDVINGFDDYCNGDFCDRCPAKDECSLRIEFKEDDIEDMINTANEFCDLITQDGEIFDRIMKGIISKTFTNNNFTDVMDAVSVYRDAVEIEIGRTIEALRNDAWKREKRSDYEIAKGEEVIREKLLLHADKLAVVHIIKMYK